MNNEHIKDPVDVPSNTASGTASAIVIAPEEQVKPSKPKRGFPWGIALALVLALAALAVGILPRLRQQSQLNQSAAAVKTALPIVTVVTPTVSSVTNGLSLPGTFEAAEQTAVNARATGYVSRVLVHIGDTVKAGQVLAIISAPDTDQQTAQGRAQLLQSKASALQAAANLSAMRGALAQQVANLGHSQAAYVQTAAAILQGKAQVAQSQNQYNQQTQAVTEQSLNTNLAKITNQRQRYLYQQGAIAAQAADQSTAAYQVDVAGLGLAKSGLSASASNIKSYQANVSAAQANQEAAKQTIGVAQAQVATAVSNIHASQAALAAAQDAVAANRAALARLTDLQAYESVTAPFAGVVTARNIDPGAFISGGSSAPTSSVIGSSAAGTSVSGAAAGGSGAAGSVASSASSSGGASAPLFTVANIKRLHIYFSLPQMYVDTIRVGQAAKITAQSFPLRSFQGKVTRSAIALDPASRTLVTEVSLANPASVLRPGMFGSVTVSVPQPERFLMVPDTALVTGASGPQVIVVSKNGTLHFQSVTVGQDNGLAMQILSGLKATDRVVATPNYSLVNGEAVQIQHSKP